jgi:hypothetical protein
MVIAYFMTSAWFEAGLMSKIVINLVTFEF